MNKVFVSYSSVDRPFVMELKAALESFSFDVWVDKESILPGQYYAGVIPKPIREADVFLLVMSASSIGDKKNNIVGSEEVAKEVVLAQHSSAIKIPIALDDCWLKDNATHDEINYLLALSQCLDAKYCETTADYCNVALQIKNSLDNKSFVFSYITTLKEIERLLQKGEFCKAKSRIEINLFPEVAADNVAIIDILISMSERKIRDFSKREVDIITDKLKHIKDPAFIPSALYVLGVLSQFYYDVNAISDPTGGVSALKVSASAFGEVNPRHRHAVSYMLPKPNQFSLLWGD